MLKSGSFLSWAFATALQLAWLRAGARGMATLGGAFVLGMLGLAGAIGLWALIVLFTASPGDTGHSAAGRFFLALFLNAAVVEPAVLACILWFRSIRPNAGAAGNAWGTAASPGAWDPNAAASQPGAASSPAAGGGDGGYKSPAPTTAPSEGAIANI